MQTFLPFQSYSLSAKCLDNKRLGKQRVECVQILNALNGGKGWRNHPAVRMWEGHEFALINYGIVMCREWTGRGFADTCEAKMAGMYFLWHDTGPPEWLGRRDFHRSHQSNLVRKDPAHYRRWFPKVPSDLPYIWPVTNANALRTV